jgi:N-acetylmuramate 1-kinase
MFLFGAPAELMALTPEVSPRRYFRANPEAGATWLVVVSPTPAPHATTNFLRSLEIRSPKIGASMAGAYLVEDLGDVHLQHAPTFENYQSILQTWLQLASAELPAGHPNLRFALNRELFEVELGMFRDCYLRGYRALQLTAGAWQAIEQSLAELAVLACAGPQCLQHRDFHSRNILLPMQGGPAWIDHQDLRSGPLYYDLASLYTDAYVELPDDVFDLLRSQILPLGERCGLHPEDAMQQFLLTALQRVLKALGTFGKVLGAGRSDFEAAEIQARCFALALLDQLAIYPELRKVLHTP